MKMKTNAAPVGALADELGPFGVTTAENTA